MKLKVNSIFQQGANFYVKMIPVGMDGDVLLAFPIDSATPVFHDPVEIRNEAAGTFKTVIAADSHVIGLKTEEGEFRIAMAASKTHEAQSGEFEATFEAV
jgi:hypothetical protein